MENSTLDLMAQKFGMNSLKPSKVIVKTKSYLKPSLLLIWMNLIECFSLFPCFLVCSLLLLLLLLFCLSAYFYFILHYHLHCQKATVFALPVKAFIKVAKDLFNILKKGSLQGYFSEPHSAVCSRT